MGYRYAFYGRRVTFYVSGIIFLFLSGFFIVVVDTFRSSCVCGGGGEVYVFAYVYYCLCLQLIYDTYCIVFCGLALM